MAIERIEIGNDYLNVVHKVSGDRDVIEYLRRGSALVNERLFFLAKRDGQTSFYFKEREYLLIRNRDASYLITPAENDGAAGTPIT